MSDNSESDSEMDESSDGKSTAKEAPLTKSGIEDLPSTLITSIHCSDGNLDDLSDEVFAWKKAPKHEKVKKKILGKDKSKQQTPAGTNSNENNNNQNSQNTTSITRRSSKVQNVPAAPQTKTGDGHVLKVLSSTQLKQRSEIKNQNSKKTSSSTSKDSLVKKTKKSSNRSKTSQRDKKSSLLRVPSSQAVKKKDSKVRVNSHRSHKK